MDVVDITTAFAKGLISLIVSKKVQKKLGFDPEFSIQKFNFTSGSTVRLNLCVEMPNEKFMKLMEVLTDEQ